MPKFKSVNIGILVHNRSALGVTILIKEIFEAANYVLGAEIYKIEFISYKKRVFRNGIFQIQLQKSKEKYDYVIVSPSQGMDENMLLNWHKESELLKSLHENNVVIASACLGVLFLASTGVLDGKQATTHWSCESFVKKNFPNVQWKMQKMLCETSSTITAGGYLAIVDLTLNIISRSSGKKVTQEIGKLLLADSTREKQSIYAAELTVNTQEVDQFKALEKWIDLNIDKNISIQEMAARCGMSLRSFQRRITSSYGHPPKKFLQLKRVQKARLLLSNSKLSIEDVVSQVGMSDVSSFRKIFLREFGMTLSEYRRRLF
ncbi:GlxA family transcriptional regulator [Bdellovibrio sp. HCB-162]|uniref:GlxA family transcriptional regulator n=1 Tax=Bdellovibrio sp. HCB-162 TaxID=3394234 RepID=UPI0039BD542B